MELARLETCLIGLGSNLGDRRQTLAQAVARLKATPGVYNVEVSSYCETKPVGGPEGQPAFLNAAVTCRTSYTPEAMLGRLQAIESEMGRVREVRWDARTLDLDLLLFGVRRFESQRLTIPHPRLATRRFVLAPALELAGNWLHPDLGLTLHSLGARLGDSRGECWLVFPPMLLSEAETIAIACRTALGSRPLVLKALPEEDLGTLPCSELGQPWMTLVLATSTKSAAWVRAVKLALRLAKLGPAFCLSSDDPKFAIAEAIAAINSASAL